MLLDLFWYDSGGNCGNVAILIEESKMKAIWEKEYNMENNRMSRNGRMSGPQVPPTRRSTAEEMDRLRHASAGLRMPGSAETVDQDVRQRREEAERRTREEIERRQKMQERGNTDMSESRRRKPSAKALARKKRVKKLWTILGVEVLVFSLLIIGYGIYYVNNKLGMLDYNQLDEEDLGINDGLDDNQEGYTTIALFGLDSRDVTSDTGNRSDTILVASIDNKTKDVKIISVYRDTYLEMENPDGKNDGLYTKITHAYAFGGPKAAVATLNKNLDLQITDYVTVNFASMAEVVDDLGGITVNVDEAERQSVNIWLPETASIAGRSYNALYETGDVTLDGLQAVTYCRIRNIGAGDIDRAARQREVLEAILTKAKTSDLSTLNTILDDVLDDISTSLSKKDLIALMANVFEYNITGNEGFPMVYHAGMYYDQAVGQDLSIDVAADLDNNVQLLHQFFYDTEIDSALTQAATEDEAGDGTGGTDAAGGADDGDSDSSGTTERTATTQDSGKDRYTPSSEVLRISDEIKNNTGVYPPDDLTFRGGF